MSGKNHNSDEHTVREYADNHKIAVDACASSKQLVS